MNDLLNNPAVQSGVIPLLLGLVLAFALARTRFLALVPWAGFVAVVALALDFALEPLTALRKLVLVGLIGGALALTLDAARVPAGPALRAGLALLAAAAALWMLARVLGQGANLWLAGAGVALYAISLTLSLLLVAGDTLLASLSATVVGVASGVLALLGASASMTQMGIALGAASGAVLLVQLLRGERAPLGGFIALPVALICSLIGVGASLTGALPWVALLPMPLIGVAVYFAKYFAKVGAGRSLWLAAIVPGVAALVPAAFAVTLAWLRVGAAPG